MRHRQRPVAGFFALDFASCDGWCAMHVLVATGRDRTTILVDLRYVNINDATDAESKVC